MTPFRNAMKQNEAMAADVAIEVDDVDDVRGEGEVVADVKSPQRGAVSGPTPLVLRNVNMRDLDGYIAKTKRHLNGAKRESKGKKVDRLSPRLTSKVALTPVRSRAPLLKKVGVLKAS